MINLQSFLGVSAILFSLGLICVLTRKNVIHLLMGLELILNAANINLVAFSRFTVGNVEGHLIALFVMVIAVAEVTVAFGIIINVYRNLKDINVDHIDIMNN